ncbi:MAG: hypothetical protein NC078_05360 [Ruminococcus sp.]|nr:hypothetical protein [Ruminococcus sp.]
MFLSETPQEGEFEDCFVYLPEKFEKECGYYIDPPEDYRCALVRVTSPGNYLLYDFDLRGH